MQNLRTWRTGVPGGGVSWNVYIIPHFAANVKIQYPNKVIIIRGKSCVWNRNATFRSAAYQKSRCTAAFFKGRASGRRQKRYLSKGKAAGARKKAHPGERVGFCRLSKNFDALPIQADQDKRKQENAVGTNIDQLTIYRYGA